MFANAALVIASVVLFAQAASAADCTRKYTVKVGDYCDSISAANKVSTYQLAVVNQGVINVACDNLQPGQELCLGTTEADCQETAVVLPGDSCSKIASKYGVESATFYSNNPQVNKDCTNIYIDEVLCVAKSVQVPGAPSIPVHTGPPASEATPPVSKSAPPLAVAPTPVAQKPASSSPVPKPAPPPPAAAKPTPSAPAVAKPPPSAPADDEDCEDEEEELEVVEGPTDEDLPFCDELY